MASARKQRQAERPGAKHRRWKRAMLLRFIAAHSPQALLEGGRCT
jgi:hypothetical protein